MKTKISIPCCLTALLMLINIHSLGQSKEIKGLTEKLDLFHQKYPEGVVYLYTDRSNYLAGESILFKAYIIDDLSNRSNSLANTLYVALIDQDGQEVASGIFPVRNYQTAGKINISKLLTEGKYVLIACTNLTKSATPDKLFSGIIEVIRSEETEFFTDLKLFDTLYTSGSNLTAKVEFSGKGKNPVPASFTYQLSDPNAEIVAGKSKAKEDGTAIIEIQLPTFIREESLKLLITASYKGSKNITAIIIPTPGNNTDVKIYPERVVLIDKHKELNIRIRTDKPQYKPNEKVIVDIYVADENGDPVRASLSVSASNPISTPSLLQNDNLLTYSSSWRQVVSGMKEEVPQIVNMERSVDTGSKSVFNFNIRKIFAQCLSLITKSPGSSFLVQEKNDLKKIKSKKETKPLMKQNGYSSDRTIFQILMQIKPYHLMDGKIIFASSGFNSINNQDGALIVIDGIKMGTDAGILNTIPVTDIARINASTNPLDIQRYTGLNNVGIIEIFMKTGGNDTNNQERLKEDISNTVFWDPDISTDSSGKATVSFFNNNKSSEVIISVEGITAGGLVGSSTVHYPVK